MAQPLERTGPQAPDANANLPLRPDLEGETPYGAPKIDVPARLNVNENPYLPPAAVIESIATTVAQTVQGLNRYPERDSLWLRTALASYLEVESDVHLAPEWVWVANGSNEVMLRILQVLDGPGRICLSFTLTYSIYPEYVRDTLIDYTTRPRRKDFTLNMDDATSAIRELWPIAVILANPNNPTGTTLPLEDIKRILKATHGHDPMFGAEIGLPVRASDCAVVIDETYAEFRRPGVPSALELVGPGNPHLAVIHAISKIFGMADLRLGYLVADRALIDVPRVIRLPHHLSAVTQAAVLAALSCHGKFMAQVASLCDERDAFVDWLRAQGLSAHESDVSFVPFRPFPNRKAVRQALLDAGVLIRVVGPKGLLRASIGTPEGTTRLRAALIPAIGR